MASVINDVWTEVTFLLFSLESRCKIERTDLAEEENMDNRYRRDHEMAYFSDASVIEEQLTAKKAVRQYNTVMPFDPEAGEKIPG